MGNMPEGRRQPDEPQHTFRYQILRYVPNLQRDG